jgi:phosphoglycolate phosphatase-like HAD superfamily hydrolase
VETDLAAGHRQQRAVVEERGANLGGQGIADAFLAAAVGDGQAVRFAEAESYLDSGGDASCEHPGDMRVGLGEECAGEDEYVDLLLGLLEQSEPHLPWHAGPVLIGADQLGAPGAERRFALPLLDWPKEGLLHAEVFCDAVAVAWVRDTSAEPAADGLGVDFAGFGEQLGCDAALGEYGVQSLVHRAIQARKPLMSKPDHRPRDADGDPAHATYAGRMALIVLWDIDHTLIDNAGVSKEIYSAAFERITDRSPAEPAVTEGRTDRLIMREMFRRNGVDEPAWAEVEGALAGAGEGRLGLLRQRGSALLGVRDALKGAASRTGWVSSVLTGNIRANAQMKLSAFDLDVLVDLPVGAYGADAMERPQLVDVARRRIRRDRGMAEGTPIVLIGDTPRDVEAALVAGAHIIAVASGVDAPSTLAAAGAAVVLPDLAHTDRVLRLLEDIERS